MAWTVAIGVDTHARTHMAVALDPLGRVLGSLEFAVDEDGFAALRRFARSFGEPAFAVEGTGSYGASLARALLADGCSVFECERPERRGRSDKNDLIDAEAAARRLLTGKQLPLPRSGGSGEREQLRLLLAERRSAQHARQQARNQLQAAIVTLDPPLRSRLGRLDPATLHRHTRRGRTPTLTPLARLSRRVQLLERELAAVDAELAELTRALCPQLLAETGVGPLCCAQVLVSAANPSRFKSEASFAALAGVSPIEASSGPIKRHRLNRGGDRQLNWALHMSALNRIRYHTETRAYYQRLLENGKTKKEATRIIKRVLARRLYRTLKAT
jgi:transposase